MLLKLIVNILWFIFGGFELALGWAVTGLILCCTIVGIPLGTQCFKMARLVMLPLGLLISMSTVFVKQHSMLDVLVAIPVSALLCVLIYKPFPRNRLQQSA